MRHPAKIALRSNGQRDRFVPEITKSHTDEYLEREEVSPAMQKRRLFALLVGICDYQNDVLLAEGTVRFPKLSGCKNDAIKVKEYLSQEPSFDAEITLLTDKEATKPEIVKHFRAQLGKAGNNDIAFFYYSGHGTQEHVDTEVFSGETDGKSESIVCYYDKNSVNQAFLSDKELRWLIGGLSSENPHILTVFDCCHSAGVTRNMDIVKNSFKNVVEKRIPFVFPERDWQQYIFSTSISQEQLKTNGEYLLLPEKNHFQISACESYEPALEVEGEGVFTKTLLKILQLNNGNISYSILMGQVVQYLKGIYEQKPRIYYTGPDRDLAAIQFLDKDYLFGAKTIAEAVHNEELGWLLNRGAIHGLRDGANPIKLYQKNSTETIDAILAQVEIDFSIIEADSANKELVYYAKIDGLLSERINVFMADNLAPREHQQQLLDELLGSLHTQVLLVDLETEANYVIRYLNQSYYITRPFDPYRPISRPVEVIEFQKIAAVFHQLEHISGWEFVRRLNSGRENIGDRLIHITYSIDGQPYQDYDEAIAINFKKESEEWKSTLGIKITNISGRIINCAALLLTADFASFSGLLNPPVYVLEAGNSVELSINGKTVIPLVPDERMKRYNVEQSTEYIKFLVSRENFSIDALIMDAIGPLVKSRSNFQDLADREGGTASQNEKWQVYDMLLCFNNPEYNLITEEVIAEMLKDDETAPFAVKLYFDPVGESSVDAGLKLKTGLLIKDRQKGKLVGDDIRQIAKEYIEKINQKNYKH